MSIPFSLVKQPLLYPGLNPTYQYVKPSNIVSHGDGTGNTNGVQTYAVKMLANQGTCGITVQALSGQSLITAFTLSRDALVTWVNSGGSNTTNIVTQTVGSYPYNKVLDSPTKDQYAWFAIGVDGYINSATPFPNDTYLCSISGNFLSPESIMKFEGGQGAPKTGTILNPTLIQPNSSNIFNSIFGDCISGSYYATFSVSANITRTITITPSDTTDVGIIISSIKTDLSTWIHNGGVGSLTDGGNYVSTGGGVVNIPILLYESKTLFVAYYDSNNIGASSCQTGIPVTISSVQEVEQGSNTGTFANPYVIANNLALSSATEHNFGQGECTKGAIYYELMACASTGYLSVGFSRATNDYDVGIAIDTDKNNLASYLRTGNPSYISNYVTLTNGMPDQGLIGMAIPPSDHIYYIMIYDVAALGTQSYDTCADISKTFYVYTEQLNCGGGSAGADGTYNHPFENVYNSGTYRVHKEGDCSQGITWFLWNSWCANSPIYLNVEPQNGQNIGVAWGIDQAAVIAWVNANGGGGGGGGWTGGICGYFSGGYYYDQVGNWYGDYGNGWWYRGSDNATFETLNLPNYCGANCGYFDMPTDPQNSAYYDHLGNTYYNSGFDSWNVNMPIIISDYHALPNYCDTVCGFYADRLNYLTSDYYVDGGNLIYTTVSEGLWYDPINDVNIDQASLPCGGMPDCGAFFDTANWSNSTYYDVVNGPYYYIYANQPGYWLSGGYEFLYFNGIETLPDYCVPGAGPGGGGGVHHMTTNVDGTYINYSGYGINETIFAAVYLPDTFPSDQCSNTNTFAISMSKNYCDQFSGGPEGSYVGQHSNPFVIANNQSTAKLHNAGECSYGSVFFQVLVCQTNALSITVSDTPRSVGIAWATDLVVLYNWITSGGESSGVNLGAYDGNFQSGQQGGTSTSFTPATNNTYYIVVYDTTLQNTCALIDQAFLITTAQSSCDGPNGNVGSYDSPIAIGSTDTLLVGANYGNCFSGQTYFTMQMCPNISGSVTITPSDNLYPQAIFYASSKSAVKQMADYYTQNGGTISWGGYYDEGHNTASSTTTSPQVTILPAYSALKTMYFALVDISNANLERCSRTGNIGVNTYQYCPIVNIGGTANISGAKRYDFDPFNYQSTIKTGVTLVTGDLGAPQIVNFLYSPMLIIDQPTEYVNPITCSNISVVLYGNAVDGSTRTLDTQSTTKAEVIIKNNQAIIKPTITNELPFTSVNFYTGLAQTTYTTNIGTFIRNQVINVGDRFDASREQYAYVTSVSGNTATVFIPVVDEDVHTLLNATDVVSYTRNAYNSYVITFNKTGIITLPFNRANKSGTQSIKIKL